PIGNLSGCGKRIKNTTHKTDGGDATIIHGLSIEAFHLGASFFSPASKVVPNFTGTLFTAGGGRAYGTCICLSPGLSSAGSRAIPTYPAPRCPHSRQIGVEPVSQDRH